MKTQRSVVVEHSGAAIDAGRTELKDMEFQMQAMGLQLIVSRSGTTTATGDMIDENKINSPSCNVGRYFKRLIRNVLSVDG